MRTRALYLTAAALAAGIATSVAQSNVYSLNIVGYVNKLLKANEKTAVATPLTTPNNTVAGIFGGVGGALPEGAQLYLWNGSGFDTGTRDDFAEDGSGWAPDGFSTNSIAPGRGYLIDPGASDVTITYIGDVLTGNDIPNQFYRQNMQDCLASVVPVAGNVDALPVPGLPAVDGDQVWLWNQTLQQWDTYTYDQYETPPWMPSQPTVQVAEGFMVQLVAPAWTVDFNP